MLKISILIFFIPIFTFSQVSVTQVPKVRSSTASVISEDLSENPAKSAEFNNQVNTYYTPNVFGLNELSPANIDALYSFSDYTHYIKINGIDSQKFRNIVLTSNSSYKLTENLNVGINFSYHALNIDNFNSYSKFSLDAGAILKMTENLEFGVSVSNLTNSNFRDDNTLLSRFMLFGFQYSLNEEISFDINAEVRSDIEPGLNLGITKSFTDFLDLRLAYSTFPGNIDGIIKITPLAYINLYTRVNYHSQLGFSNTIGLAYLF